jgi:uncharacterized repeat protein (TIGR03803 family)
VLHSFSRCYGNTNNEGADLRSPLCIIGDTLYGTASGGGFSGYGTIFKIKTNGTDFAVLHQFPSPNGSSTSISGLGPWAGLTVSGDKLYGVAANDQNDASGSVYSLNIDGTGFTVVYSFTPAGYGSTNIDGGLPLGEVVVSGNRLYGTAAIRGAFNEGTVFSIRLADIPSPPIISSVTQSNGSFVLTCATDPAAPTKSNTKLMQFRPPGTASPMPSLPRTAPFPFPIPSLAPKDFSASSCFPHNFPLSGEERVMALGTFRNPILFSLFYARASPTAQHAKSARRHFISSDREQFRMFTKWPWASLELMAPLRRRF